jgi:hypothetical protein
VQPYQRPRLPRPVDRNELVRRARAHLDLHGYSRIELFVIVALAGVAGFLVSYGLLNGGLHSMPARYATAGAAAYLAFLLLIRLWIVWKSGARADFEGVDHLDVLDLAPRPFGEAPASGLFEGGRSGGGGATASWGDTRGGGSKGSSWLDWDADSGWVIVALVALLAGVSTVGYVVYLAPALFAEVLVDGVIVAAVSRRVAGIERRDWTATVLRHTWLPALVMLGSLVVGGWALQKIAPDARSLGPAVQQLLE